MTPHTTQSAATSASPEEAPKKRGSVRPMSYSQPRPPAPPPVSVAQACPPWRALLPVRLCCGTRNNPPHLALSLTSKILIANLELESELTHTKLSPLNISNRKYSAIFHPGVRAHSPLANRNKTAISGPTQPVKHPRSLNGNSSLDSSPLVWLRSSSLLSKPLLRRVKEEKN